MQTKDILNIIEQADDLPTLPTVATKVMQVTSDADTSVKEVAVLIEKDLALSAKILQVINSPFYGFSRGITSVSEAVGLMGFREVGNLALGLSVMGILPQDETIGFSFQTFWEHCVGQAVSAVKITAAVDPDLSYGIFTTALLQDIGTCLLVRYTPLVYGYSLALAKERQVHVAVAEREVLQTDHAEIGARILAHWNLPGEVINAVRWHHDPDSPDACDLQMDVVYLANLLCQTSEISCEAGGHAIELSPTVIDRLGIQLDQFETISGKVARWVDELSDALAFN